ncbi:MAG: hypothetical protein Kow0077_18920 [Anaerolineae bacterium]
MLKQQILRWAIVVIALSASLVLSACQPAESALSASDAWARAAAATMADSEAAGADATATSEGMGGMNSDSEAMDMAGSPAVSAAYLTLTNSGGAADRLVGAETDAATVVEIHTVEMDNGVMRMRPVADGIEVPAGGSISLEPGGYHLMLIDLTRDLVAGETIALTLHFASGKTLQVEAEVRNP